MTSIGRELCFEFEKPIATPSGTSLEPVTCVLKHENQEYRCQLVLVSKKVDSLARITFMQKLYGSCPHLMQTPLLEWVSKDPSGTLSHRTLQPLLLNFEFLQKVDFFAHHAGIHCTFFEAAIGLEELHNSGVVHKDLRASNLFIDPITGKAGIGDLSEAESYDSSHGCEMRGLPDKDYPPEILTSSLDILRNKLSIEASLLLLDTWESAQEREMSHPRVDLKRVLEAHVEHDLAAEGRLDYTKAADVYALGHTFFKILHSSKTWESYDDSPFHTIIWDMLHPDPKCRPTISNVVIRLTHVMNAFFVKMQRDELYLNFFASKSKCTLS